MTPERKAELRQMDFRRFVTGYITTAEAIAEGGAGSFLKLENENAVRDEMLGEIDRLEGLVREAHRFDYERTTVARAWFGPPDNFVIRVFCTACPLHVAELPCKDPYGSPRTDKAKAIHAAHVEAILRSDNA